MTSTSARFSRSPLGFAILSALCISAGSTANAQTPGPFTAAQAAAGSGLFQSTCAACHGANLEGTPTAPTLSGTGFMTRWSGRSAGELFRYIKSSMPPGSSSPLPDASVGNIVAQILASNGAVAGTQPLNADTAMLIGAAVGNAAVANAGAPQAPRRAEAPVGVTVAGTVENFVPLTDEMMRNPDPANWLMWRGNYQAWSYSALDQVTRDNVKNLKLEWVWNMVEGASEPAPIVYNGVMYLINTSNIIQVNWPQE